MDQVTKERELVLLLVGTDVARPGWHVNCYQNVLHYEGRCFSGCRTVEARYPLLRPLFSVPRIHNSAIIATCQE